MPDDVPEIDQPDPDRVCRYYVETCRRRGVEPVPRDRAQELIAEWWRLIADSGIPPVNH